MVIEDDPDIQDVIRLYLEKNGFEVIALQSGDGSVALLEKERPDLVILDVLLPGSSGFDICQELRKVSPVPIIFLSCKKEETDKIQGLNYGGDDYMTKPFSPNELIARVRALLRRPYLVGAEETETSSKRLTFGELQIDPGSRVVTVRNQELTLSRKEFDLLYMLATHPERTFTHEQLFREIWGQECFNDTRTIIVHISNLRKKIEPDTSSPKHIINVHGVGYKFLPGS